MKLSDQIRAAAKRLTSETWIKVKYFQEKNGVLCMCAHGAMQVECNPLVNRTIKKQITNKNKSLTDYLLHTGVYGALASSHTITDIAAIEGSKASSNTDTQKTINWENRPDWVRETDPERGNLEAHYLLGMVGLTTSFNDDPRTTLEKVLEKFEQAAKLAETFVV